MTHQARDNTARLEPREDRVRELQRPVALALGVRVRGATVDVALVQALTDILCGLVKVHGSWLCRPALGPWRKDKVDLDAADGLGEKAYLDIESRGRWVIGNCARPTSVGRVVRGRTQEDMGLVTKARHDARDGGLRSELGLRAHRMGDAGERWGSGREEGEHCGDGNARLNGRKALNWFVTTFSYIRGTCCSAVIR